jgi:hypothetical protein
MKILGAEDWSGSFRDLRLGVEVLRGNYDEAAKLMREIGKIGELVREAGYRDWPVFREFRESPQFVAAFSEIYGKEFATSETEITLALVKSERVGGCPDVPAADTIDQPEIIPGESDMPSYPPTDDEDNDSDEKSHPEQQ